MQAATESYANVEIVDYRAEHGAAVKGLLGEMTAEYAPLLPHILRDQGGVVPDVESGEGIYQRVALLGDEVVGYAYGKVMSSNAHPALCDRRYFYLNEIVVTTRVRNLGIGSKLLADSEAFAAAHGLTDVELNVYAMSPAAQRFYRRHGYEVLVMRMAKRNV